MFKHIVGGINKVENSFPIVFEPYSETDDAKTEPGTDNQNVFGPNRPHGAIIEKAEAQIEAVPLFMVP